MQLKDQLLDNSGYYLEFCDLKLTGFLMWAVKVHDAQIDTLNCDQLHCPIKCLYLQTQLALHAFFFFFLRFQLSLQYQYIDFW